MNAIVSKLRLVVGAACISALALTHPGHARADIIVTTPVPFCDVGTTTQCIVSATVGGVPVTSADPVYDIAANRYPLNGAQYYHFLVSKKPGYTWDLDPSLQWVIQLNTGSVYPAETFARGKDVTVTRGGNAVTGYTTTYTMNPVRMEYGACDSVGVCAGTAVTSATGYLEAELNDLGYVADAGEKAIRTGFDLASNTDWVSTPLQLDPVTNSIKLDVANAHFETDGTTVFTGHAEFRIPNAMLSGLYGVDDPGTLTAAAFAVTTGSGPATTNIVVSPGSVYVSINGLTFSKRALRITGRTQPRAPRHVRAERTRPGRGVIRSWGSLARGSKVRGYNATCIGGGRTIRVRTSGADSLPVRVGSLTPGVAYRCTLKARSKAGLSVGVGVTIPA